MAEQLTESLLDLERRGWDSLCGGTGPAFYGALMTEDATMVLATGRVLGRDEVVTALDGAPPWDTYSLSDVRLVMAGAGAALVYTAFAHREGAEPFVAAMSSLYVVTDDGWRLAVHTQTSVSAPNGWEPPRR
jgi:hypothetical protein